MEDENFIREKELSNQPQAMSMRVFKMLEEISRTHVCKIFCEDGSHGTGFFLNINDLDINLKVLMTNNHVLNEKNIESDKTIKFSLDNDKNFYSFLVGEDRKTYTNDYYDVTIIEIKKEDNLKDISFFDIDKQINGEKVYEKFRNYQICLLHYQKGIEIMMSPGVIRNVSEDDRTIYHLCATSGGSSGGPIINQNSFQVIGIHKGGSEKGKNYNLGTLLKLPIEEFKNQIRSDTEDNSYLDCLKKSVYIEEKEGKESKDTNTDNINDDKNIDEIKIEYKINNIDTPKDIDIQIFGEEFVENNKNICKINLDGNDLELSSNLNIKSSQLNKNILEIKLKGVKKVTDMSYIFHNCKYLSSLPDISNWNTRNVVNMSNIFDGCESLSTLPDISNWNTSNVTDMSSMFSYCISLASLPDISKWNTQKVRNLSFMFWNCKNISTLPDISNWNTQNVITMSHMFFNCESLTSLPDITIWNTENVTNISFMFYNCKSLTSLPDISKWNIQNVTDMLFMFCDCKSLSSLPDISNWDTKNVTDMRSMFLNCKQLASLPDISKWNTQNVTNMSSLFWNCKSLLDIPDISKWNIQNGTDNSSMFEGCNKNFPKF